MGLIDHLLRFSAAQALTGDAPSTNSIPLGAERRIGDGEPIAVEITVDVAAAGGGTINFILQSDTDSAFGSAATVAQTGAVAAAACTAGAKFVLPIPPGVNTETYLRMYYDLTTMTGITVSARLTPLALVSSGALYPDAITID